MVLITGPDWSVQPLVTVLVQSGQLGQKWVESELHRLNRWFDRRIKRIDWFPLNQTVQLISKCIPKTYFVVIRIQPLKA